MAAKRPNPRPRESGDLLPAWNAALVAAAVAVAGYVLVARGRLSWPPRELIATSSTLVGCLTLIGPLILWTRRGDQPGSLGDLVWMACGLSAWAFGLSLWARGDVARLDWIAPAEPRILGAVAIAASVAAWRIGRLRLEWSWTGVVGGCLALFWIATGMADSLARDPSRFPAGRAGLFPWLAGP